MKSALRLMVFLLLVTGCRHVEPERFPADVRINDQPVHFVYDTGAGATLVHARTAKRLGLKVSKPPSAGKAAPGKVKAGQTEICRLTVGDETYRLRLATVHLPWPWEALMDMDGVIGWPDLKDDLLAINAPEDAIQSLARLPQDTNGWTRLLLYQRTDVLALAIPRLDGKTGVLEVDTGNEEGVSLSPARWKQWRAAHPHARGAWHFGFMPGSGLSIGRSYEAEDLAIGPLTWKRVDIHKACLTETSIAAEGDVSEGSIGLAALRQLNLIIDRTNHLAYVRSNPDWVAEQETERKKTSCRSAAFTRSTVRLGFREHEYSDLAVAAFESGDFDAVLTNATHLLELHPNDAGALAIRGIARFRVQVAAGSTTNLDTALADLSRSLELDPGITPAYRVRGNSYYLTARWDEALRDYRWLCDKVPNEASYPRFFIWIIQTRTRQPAVADQELAAWFRPGRKLKANRWEKSIAAFLLGRMSEADFLGRALKGASGHDTGRQCEAWFYAGMKRCLFGDADTARGYFRNCMATGKKDYDEYSFAAAELRALAPGTHASR